MQITTRFQLESGRLRYCTSLGHTRHFYAVHLMWVGRVGTGGRAGEERAPGKRGTIARQATSRAARGAKLSPLEGHLHTSCAQSKTSTPASETGRVKSLPPKDFKAACTDAKASFPRSLLPSLSPFTAGHCGGPGGGAGGGVPASRSKAQVLAGLHCISTVYSEDTPCCRLQFPNKMPGCDLQGF